MEVARWRRTAAGLLAVAFAAACGTPSKVPEDPKPRTQLPERVTLRPAKAETFTYRLSLQAGDLVRVVAQQEGADAELLLIGPGDDLVQHVDRPNKDRGEELLLAVAREGGEHQLRVPVNPIVAGGHATVRLDRLQPANDDERRLAALYAKFLVAKQETSVDRLELLAHRFEQAAQPLLQAEALLQAGMLLAGNDDRKAEELIGRSEELFRQQGARSWEGVARRHRTAALINQNRAAEALTQAEELLAFAEELGWPWLRRYAFRHLGQAYYQRGQNQKALHSFESTLQEGSALCDAPGPDALYHLGLLQARVFHRGSRALGHFEKVLHCFGIAGSLSKQSKAIGQMGRVHLDAGRLAKAEEFFLRAETVDPDLKECARAKLLARRAEVACLREDSPRGLALAADSERLLIDGACRPGDEGDAPFQLAKVWSWAGDLDRARQAYRSVLDQSSIYPNPIREAWARVGLARLDEGQGRKTEALALAREAVEDLLAVRLEVENDTNRIAFFASAQDAFSLYIQLLTEDGRAERALEVAEAARARSFHDRAAEVGVDLSGDASDPLATALAKIRHRILEVETIAAESTKTPPPRRRIDQLFEELAVAEGRLRAARSRSAQALAPTTLKLPAIQAQLDEGTLLLVYRLGEERSYLWEVDRTSLHLHKLEPRARIDRRAGAALDSLARTESDGADVDLCPVSDLVLAPVAARLRAGADRQLVIVGDGALQRVPFAALPVAEAGRDCAPASPRLVELLPLSTVPSISSLAQLRRAYADREPAARPLIAFGDPVYTGSDPRCTSSTDGSANDPPRLTASGVEVRAVCSETGGRCFTGFEASRERVLSAGLEGYSALLFSVHGEIDEAQPLLSSLLFGAGDPGCQDPPRPLYAYEIAGLRLNAQLTVLSACESGLGTEVRGEGLINGLVQSFLTAGSARVLATLWRVGDEDAAKLVTAFFAAIEAGAAPPEALRQAQLEQYRLGMAARGWAPFVLFGEWRPWPAAR